MSKVEDILNRLELAAKRLGVDIEHALLILEGKHPEKVVAPVVAPGIGTPATPVVSVPPAPVGVSVPASTVAGPGIESSESGGSVPVVEA